jgi:hypothetical protein
MLIRLKYFDGDFATLDDHYNAKLEIAVANWQKSLPDVQDSGQYGRGTWEAARRARVLDGPNKGEYAMDAVGRDMIRKEWKANQEPTVDDVRAALTDFCLRAESHEGVWTYTQRRPYSGLGDSPEEAHRNDCSSYVILAYYWARKVTGIAVPDPSGWAYNGSGNTWSDLDGHTRVSGSYLVGDLAHYDGHVTLCRRAGDFNSSIWSSMGSDAGPDARKLYYRDDFLFVVRPELA